MYMYTWICKVFTYGHNKVKAMIYGLLDLVMDREPYLKESYLRSTFNLIKISFQQMCL